MHHFVWVTVFCAVSDSIPLCRGGGGGGHRGRGRMVVHITTKVQSSNPVHGEVYAIQHCVIKYVSVSCDRSVVFPGYTGFLHQ